MGRIEHPFLNGNKPPIRPKTVARDLLSPKAPGRTLGRL
jgi:hypothetical protein